MDDRYRTLLIIILMVSPTIFAFSYLSIDTSHHVVTSENDAVFAASGEIYEITVSTTSASSSTVRVQVDGEMERSVVIDTSLYTFYLPVEVNERVVIFIINSNDSELPRPEGWGFLIQQKILPATTSEAEIATSSGFSSTSNEVSP